MHLLKLPTFSTERLTDSFTNERKEFNKYLLLEPEYICRNKQNHSNLIKNDMPLGEKSKEEPKKMETPHCGHKKTFAQETETFTAMDFESGQQIEQKTQNSFSDHLSDAEEMVESLIEGKESAE